ncbi:VWA domain-containing protein [Algihabitans albus]|uniref:VWA domain-containing protein n=1 Tax=Algihabitans albus TaxID=2164067 RepID=UPI000E5CCFE5|nr:VWA domain-containing protein [Algihabitans albus]
MSDLQAALAAFHLLRPWWLTVVPIAMLLWWGIRRRATRPPAPPKGVAPHLAAALTLGGTGPRRLLPIDGIALTLALLALAAAGPTWSRVPNPLMAQTAPLAVALEVSDSMQATDLPPNRLERAKHKILDLMAARGGGRLALIAYAGSAHRVVPLTEDLAVLKPFLEALSPDIMPSPGQNATQALDLAAATLAEETTPGAILFVLDDLDRADLPSFERHIAGKGPPVLFLSLASRDAPGGGLPGGATVVRGTPDRSDVAQLNRRIASAYRAALARDERLDWADKGWILAWPAALLTLLWFRRGWTMRWALLPTAVLLGGTPGTAQADGWGDWFLTADQQGRLAYEAGDFAAAGERFADPQWKGYALYRAGRYAEAAEVLARLDSAEAIFARGMALVRSRDYRGGIAAFEAAVARDPSHQPATRNLEIARAILDYVERAREQSDTGEESGIGADDTVFDNAANRGNETRATAEEQMAATTAEQWMRNVDTQAADFLRLRFALEAAEARP